jgi:hypothetical protein
MMKFILAVMIVIEVGTAAAAQLFITQPSEGVPLLTMLPADAATVADYYKQKVYDPADEKIGEIVDLVIEKSGYVPAVIIAVSCSTICRAASQSERAQGAHRFGHE